MSCAIGWVSVAVFHRQRRVGGGGGALQICVFRGKLITKLNYLAVIRIRNKIWANLVTISRCRSLCIKVQCRCRPRMFTIAEAEVQLGSAYNQSTQTEVSYSPKPQPHHSPTILPIAGPLIGLIITYRQTCKISSTETHFDLCVYTFKVDNFQSGPNCGNGNDVKPHQCQQCLKSFSSNHQLVQHIRVHTGEKPYKCSYCDRRFKQLSHVQQHTRLHTGKRT